MQKSTKKLLIVAACVVAVAVVPYGTWRLVHQPEMELGESEKFTKAELLLAVETVSAHLAKDGVYIESVWYDEKASNEMLDGFSKVADKENSVWLQADMNVDWMTMPFIGGDSGIVGKTSGFGWTLTQQENGTWEIIRGCCGYA